MSNSQLYVPGKDSKPIQTHCFLRPTPEFRCENPANLVLDKDQKREGIEYQEGVKNQIAVTCSCSCSCSEERGIEEVALASMAKSEEEVKGEEAGTINGCVDDGYQTPTSQSHRIPVILTCPPAPKKPPRRLYTKRKAGSDRVRLHINFTDEIGLAFCAKLHNLRRRRMNKDRDGGSAT